jgi:RNA polymerase subunit RPABC4/transcription elongation factor Spt4
VADTPSHDKSDADFLRFIAADYEYANVPSPMRERLLKIADSLVPSAERGRYSDQHLSDAVALRSKSPTMSEEFALAATVPSSERACKAIPVEIPGIGAMQWCETCGLYFGKDQACPSVRSEREQEDWKAMLDVVRYSDFPTDADEAAAKILAALPVRSAIRFAEPTADMIAAGRSYYNRLEHLARQGSPRVDEIVQGIFKAMLGVPK